MGKILILANNDIGLYNFRKELIEELLREYKVYISLPYGKRIKDLIAIGCEYINTPIDRHGTNILQDFKLLLTYKKIIKDIKPDIVLTYTIKPNIYGGIACITLKTPYIANITGLGTAVENDGIMQKLTTTLYKIAFKKVKCVFFQNVENQNFFLDKKIVVNRNKLIPGSGVNLEHFHVLEYPPEDTTEFAYISRIMKQKGIDQYLEAAEYIKGKYPNTKFHICGFCEEEYDDKLIYMQKRGIIQYHGMLRDVRDVLMHTHCTIHPTYYPEGMSNVLLESAACGRPIITTNRSGCRELVDNGVSGYIVEQQNGQDLIDKIEKFLELKYEDKKQMGLFGRSKVEREFDRKIVVDSYITEIRRRK